MGRRWGIIPTRGVYQGLAFSGALTSGSSPLARGLRGPSPPACLDLGIIPARAGFTNACTSGTHDLRDHPRSRGVYTLSSPLCIDLSGSSPLARGLRAAPGGPVGEGRIIPARAGFTSRRGPCWSSPWDHPRSRGVYHSGTSASAPAQGSSPLARGLRTAGPGASGGSGIIPARAGFTD